jgi:hypothetical protein
MAKKRLISFKYLPASWGLKGNAYAVAEAHYYYEGEELERALAVINLRDTPAALTRKLFEIDRLYGHINKYEYDHKVAEFEINDPQELAIRKLKIDVAHKKISAYEAAQQEVAITTEAGVKREIALLDVEYRFDRLKKAEYEKQRASLKDEPWIAIINSGFDPEQGLDGVFFEFDWNVQWIEFLKLNGYVGHNDDQIVDDWFTDVCRSHTATERMPVVRDDD